jgi:hypothetical protein
MSFLKMGWLSLVETRKHSNHQVDRQAEKRFYFTELLQATPGNL